MTKLTNSAIPEHVIITGCAIPEHVLITGLDESKEIDLRVVPPGKSYQDTCQHR